MVNECCPTGPQIQHPHSFLGSPPLPHPLWPLQSASYLSFRCLSSNFPFGNLITTTTITSHIVPESDAHVFDPSVPQNLGNKQPWRAEIVSYKEKKKQQQTNWKCPVVVLGVVLWILFTEPSRKPEQPSTAKYKKKKKMQNPGRCRLAPVLSNNLS